MNQGLCRGCERSPHTSAICRLEVLYGVGMKEAVKSRRWRVCVVFEYVWSISLIDPPRQWKSWLSEGVFYSAGPIYVSLARLG